MDQNEKLQQLLRLKRHEQPPEGFTEEFLEKFQRRQRTELMRRSAFSILWERGQAWLEGLRRPAVIWSVAAVYAVVLVSLWMVPRPTHEGTVMMLVTPSASRANAVPVGHNIQMPPGKARTPGQTQNKEDIIGPETKEDNYEQPPLRDL